MAPHHLWYSAKTHQIDHQMSTTLVVCHCHHQEGPWFRTGTATTEPRRTEPHRNRTAGEPWKPNRQKVPLALYQKGFLRPGNRPIWGGLEGPRSPTAPPKPHLLPPLAGHRFFHYLAFPSHARPKCGRICNPPSPGAPCSTTQQGTDSSTISYFRPVHARNASTIWAPEKRE